MKVAHFNACGLSGKIDILNLFQDRNDIDLFFVTETFYTHNTTHRGMGRPFLNLTKPDNRSITGGRRAVGGIAGFMKPGDPLTVQILHTDPNADYSILKVQSDFIVAIGYFAPSTNDTKLISFLDTVRVIAGDFPCVILGDFNAHLGELNGDHSTNGRGKLLKKWLKEERNLEFRVELPTTGKWTTFGHGGMGITDIVITRNTDIAEYTIWEDESLGGSDHRPLTFSIGGEAPRARQFERWNIRALSNKREAELWRNYIKTTHRRTIDQLSRTPELNVDDAWELVKKWIEEGAQTSCGRFKFKRQLNRDFEDEELIAKRAEVTQRQANLQQVLRMRLPMPVRSEASKLVTKANKELRQLIAEKRSAIFEKVVNDLGQPQNAAAFMKMVSCQKGRRNRQNCALDPEKIEEHAEHFRNTFGKDIDQGYDMWTCPKLGISGGGVLANAGILPPTCNSPTTSHVLTSSSDPSERPLWPSASEESDDDVPLIRKSRQELGLSPRRPIWHAESPQKIQENSGVDSTSQNSFLDDAAAILPPRKNSWSVESESRSMCHSSRTNELSIGGGITDVVLPPKCTPPFCSTLSLTNSFELHVNEEVPEHLRVEEAIHQGRILTAIASIANGKACGVDGLYAEFYKCCPEEMALVLEVLFRKVYLSRRIPKEWCKAIIVPVFKGKNSEKDIANYRPIAVTCVVRRLYERVLLQQLEEVTEMLQNQQNGFRRNRSTLQQVFALHEIMCDRVLHNIFLDLKAAYDTVNRQKLWIKLADQFGIHPALIDQLKALFDHNESILVVNGKQSAPIENRRGLLQGSSLSPILFNFYIDDLIKDLNINGPKVVTRGFHSNALFFADDGNLHASSIQDMRKLLSICEEWSNQNDMEFAPTKCFYVGPHSPLNFDLKLYGTRLPVVPMTKYLGMMFTKTGINFEKSFAERTSTTSSLITLMGDIGMNATGWPLRASAHAYKAFIRPTMEYGLGLGIQATPIIKQLQKVQNQALRRMLNAPSNASIAAMHKLTQLEQMETRNHILNVKFVGRLHNSREGRIPAVRIWNNSVQGAPKSSLVSLAIKKNRLWKQSAKRNQVTQPLKMGREVYSELDIAPLKQKQQQEFVYANIASQTGRVADAIHYERDVDYEKMRRMCLPDAYEHKSHRNLIQRWVIGAICQHQECQICGVELSRQHGLDCSGAAAFLRDNFALEWDRDNEMDTVLNATRHQADARDTNRKLFSALSMIMDRCRGYQLQPNGFWVLPEEVDNIDRNPANEVSAPLTGTWVRDPAKQQQNRQIADDRSQIKRYSWMRRANSSGIG